MSTHLTPPIGDVDVNTPGGNLEGRFDWDEMQRKIIYDHREYHLAMMHFLDDLERNGAGGSDMPRKPKGDLASLLGNKKPSNKLCGVELHTYLSFLRTLLINQVLRKTGSILIWTKLDHT